VKLSDFNYSIPEDLIAQHPLPQRDFSRLLVLHKDTNRVEHRRFSDVHEYFNPGDVLVLNDTKVIPVRMSGRKSSGGKAEITLLQELGPNKWEALVKGLNSGLIFIEKNISAKVTRQHDNICEVEFAFTSDPYQHNKPDIRDYIEEIGDMPLPVYIKRKSTKSDRMQYQTVYAKKEGAVAAPTAGLHFTESLLNNIKKKGIFVCTITLHIGYGTFRPVKVTEIEEHTMDEERVEVPDITAEIINAAKKERRRVIAVGTTVTRALEAFTDQTGRLGPGTGRAGIFIYPGYTFRIPDALLTNFHLPQSTPMMLASAFSGLQLLKKSYKTAISENYRFFSFGDAMLIL
jgi:S-adenosylmethionine:tRNA ribosyltransferase-isomerase